MDEPGQQINSIVFLLNNQFVDVQPMSLGIAIAFILIGVLLLFSALISGSEVAFFSLSPTLLDEIKQLKTRSSTIINELLDNPKELLATILISNNFVNVGIVILSTFIVDSLFVFHLASLKFAMHVVAVTFLLLLFGEVIPKIYANRQPKEISLYMAFPLMILTKIFYPLSSLLIKSTSIIDSRFKKKGHQISVKELSKALELTKGENQSEDEKKILEGIVKFGSTTVKQVMTSRMDVIAIGENEPFKDVIAKITEHGYSRIPVYQDSFDSINGILYVKDLLPHLSQGDRFKWNKLVREPFFVPENKKLDDLLSEFQHKKIHLAVVVDEYGGSSGIITLEDVIEEIVGDISDEFDEDDLLFSKIDDSNYVFEGKISLNDVAKILDLNETFFDEYKGDADTLAGCIIEIAGKIPKKNETLKIGDLICTIEAADKKRVKQIKISMQENETISKH